MAWEFIFSGTVQGVGFRFRTAALANRLQVRGFVKNLRTGQVQLVVAGDESTAKSFANTVADAMGGHVENVATREFMTDEQFDQFEIRH